ncbi:Ku protein [Dactylosporangium sp. McL0621]|uniref:non-homologous end joining protein Ku n=1 Tax=Dactylosporangium sp. McL0621 TaxID=3415678 RepID=UPI003CF285BF
MARSIWTGVISFGLVSVPVSMYTATHEHEVSFHQFEKGTSDRIRYHRVNERTGKEVELDDIVKGADVGGGQYVMLEPDELDEIAPGRSRSLEIHRFVDLGAIDPVHYVKTYYLEPASDETKKTYVLLRTAMAEANRAAIATLVMRGKEYLAAIRPEGDLLVLETMYFADEIRDPRKELDRYPGKVALSRQELRMAARLLESMAGPWRPADFRDTYTERVRDLIDAKIAGNELTPAEEPPAATAVGDLMEVLRRSVEAARERRGAKPPAKPRKKATAAKKQPAAAAKKQPTTTAAAAAAKKGTAAKKLTPPKKLSKAELAKRAAKLGIKGRSTMTRTELERAVAKAA